MKKQYWMCIIGPVDLNKYEGNGADWPLRQSVRDQFNETFGPDEVCASGWGINEERYQLLRSLHLKSTIDLRKLLNQ